MLVAAFLLLFALGISPRGPGNLRKTFGYVPLVIEDDEDEDLIFDG